MTKLLSRLRTKMAILGFFWGLGLVLMLTALAYAIKYLIFLGMLVMILAAFRMDDLEKEMKDD